MDFSDQNSHQAINETYKIWKKNVPFLYNILQTYQLPSCSQTIDVMPETYLQDSWEINRLVIGSNSLVKNYIMIINVRIPTDDSLVDFTTYKEEKSGDPSIATMGQQQLNIENKFPQNGQILKIRIFRGESHQLLAGSVGGQNSQYFIYDLGLETTVVEDRKITLNGHECEGFGLDWHPLKPNMLASGAYDQRLCVWNIEQSKQTMSPFLSKMHEAGVEDVQWSRKCPDVIGSACQDKTINLWDMREDSGKPVISKLGHNGEVYSLSFNPFSEYLLVSGGEDSDINLWDTRNMNKKIHTFIGHNDTVSRVQWSEIDPYKFTSSGFDRRVLIWDMKGLNENKQQQNNNEILFIHGGHRTKVTDFCWTSKHRVCCSTEENNVVQVWSMTDRMQQEIK